MINLGAMRHIVRVERRSTIVDAANEPVLSWIFVAQIRVEIATTPGKELFTSQERLTRVPTTFKLRFLEGLTSSMRFILIGWNRVTLAPTETVYNIVSVENPDNVKELHVVTAEELVENVP